MEILKNVFIGFAIVYAITFLVFSFKTGKPLKTIILNASLGLGAFIVLNLLSGYTGVHLGMNAWTVLCSAATGMPGVVLMVIMRNIWMI